jgi:hypothetical protein
MRRLEMARFGRSRIRIDSGDRRTDADGWPPIDNASFVVDGARIVQVGRAADVRVPAGAARVNLAGKTVMPAIIDTHTHPSQTREALLNDLRRRAYFGIGAALSPGQDTADVAYEVRAQTLSGMARFFTAGRGITGPEPGRTTAPYRDRSAHGRPGERQTEGRHHQDLGRRPDGDGEDDRKH